MDQTPDTSLHVYSPYAHHDPAYIVGTKAGLLTLLEAVLDAILARPPQLYTVCAADGEGYALQVRCVPDDSLQAYASPYAAAWAQNGDQGISRDWPLKSSRGTAEALAPRPCPFCGAQEASASACGGGGFQVRCHVCGGAGPLSSTQAEAVALWQAPRGECP